MLMHTDRMGVTASSETGRQGRPAVQLDGVTKRFGDSIGPS